MQLHVIGQIVNSCEGMLEKLSLSQVSTFLNAIENDVHLAQYVFDLIQNAHGLGLPDDGSILGPDTLQTESDSKE